jgi:hypothetical protein
MSFVEVSIKEYGTGTAVIKQKDWYFFITFKKCQFVVINKNQST